MALLNGVDLIVELPVFFACASAEYFARAAVKLLDDMRVDFLCFGSESGDINALNTAADILGEESEGFRQVLREGLQRGMSYPKARGAALSAANAPVTEPNDILGVEYLKALKRLKSDIKPYTVKRGGAHYHDTAFHGDTASATAIRKSILNADGRDISAVMPQSAVELLHGVTHNHADRYGDILRYALATLNKGDLGEIADIGEGLENRILSAARSGGGFTQIAEKVKTKRYAYTRVNRALFHIILSIRKSELDFYAQTGYSRYIRVLGFKKDSADLLGMICDRSALPVVTNLKRALFMFDRPSVVMLEKELEATSIYYAPLRTAGGVASEFATPLVVFK
jgi:predicted nucleotidyltransferase